MKTKLNRLWNLMGRLKIAAHAFVRVLFGNEFARRSYSQYGEDMTLQAIFARYPSTYSGFYVDIGAHHPARFSNTRFFYEQGWRGICMDPLPGSARRFSQQRPCDRFIEAGIAKTVGEMTYFMFSEPALNTFSEKIASENTACVTGTKMVKVYPLQRILEDNLPPGRTIDFLSIDAEGMDIEVLCSNDWKTFRPLVVLIEEMSLVTLADVDKLECAFFMKQQGYKAFARTPGGLFFVDARSETYDGGGLYLRFINSTTLECGTKGIA